MSRLIKSILCMSLAACMLLCGCGAPQESQSETTAETTAAATTVPAKPAATIDETANVKRYDFLSIKQKTNEITFLYGKELISPYKLSSGEKQILVILLTVLIQDQQRCVLFMDEPEVSLHVEWQQQLISLIRKLNPNVQIILTTHSPAVIMNGWIDAVTEVSDITQDI